MKSKSILFIVIFIFLTISSSVSYSQQLHKIYNVPGGGSGTTNTSVDSNDDYILYIVGGAVIAGIVVYALLKEKKDNPKTDTTAAILNSEFLEKQLILNDQILKYQSQIQINISIGMQNDILQKEDKRYFVGLNYNF